MTILKRSLLYLKGKLSRSIMLCMFMFFLTLSYMLAFFCYSSSCEYRKIMVSRYPPEIALYSPVNTESNTNPLPVGLIEHALKTPHITGYNTMFLLQALPSDFINVVTFREKDGLTPLPPSDIVEIRSDLFTSRNQLFTTGQAVLESGDYPDETHPGVVIENTLAEKNNLSLGDELSFTITQEDRRQDVRLPVVGIYKLVSPIDVMYGQEVHYSQNSVMFMAYSTLRSLPNLNSKITSVVFFLDSYDSTAETLDKLNSLEFDHQTYAFGVSTSIPVGQLIKSMDMVDNYVSITIITYVSVSVMIFILLLILVLRNYYYDAGVLLALGENKKSIFLQYMLQVIISTIVAVLLSIICAVAVLPKIPDFWINQVTKPYAEGSLLTVFDEQRKCLTSAFNVNFALTDILAVVIFVLCILALFMVYARFVIFRSNSRKIFAKNDL